jgi:hypothetical protein
MEIQGKRALNLFQDTVPYHNQPRVLSAEQKHFDTEKNKNLPVSMLCLKAEIWRTVSEAITKYQIKRQLK